MDFINLILAATQPSGMWEKIIFGLENNLLSYGLTIIVVTLIIKVILLPTDLLNRLITKINTRKQAKIQPELTKIQRQFGNNKEMLNRKTMELYKRENYSVVGTCFGMLISIVLSSVIFLTLLGGMNSIASYKIYTEFDDLRTTYSTVYDAESSKILLETGLESLSEAELVIVTKTSQEATVERYAEIKTGFLWIKNIWRPDNYKSVVPDFKQFNSLLKDKVEGEVSLPSQAEYEKIMNPVAEANSGWNGYFILTILSAGATFISMKIPEWTSKIRAKKKGVPYLPLQQNKVMGYIMPAILALFTLLYNAAFAIYIVTGSIFSMLFQPLIGLVVGKIDDKLMKKEESKIQVSYSRKK